MVLSLPNDNAFPNLFEWFSTNVSLLVVIWISIHSAYATWWRRHYEATLEFMTGWCPTSTLFITLPLHHIANAHDCVAIMMMPIGIMFSRVDDAYDSDLVIHIALRYIWRRNMFKFLSFLRLPHKHVTTLVGICCKRARCFITDWFSAISHGLRLADLDVMLLPCLYGIVIVEVSSEY